MFSKIFNGYNLKFCPMNHEFSDNLDSTWEHPLIKVIHKKDKHEITYVFNNITNDINIILDELGTESRFIETQRLHLNGSDIGESSGRPPEVKHMLKRLDAWGPQSTFGYFDTPTNRSRIQEYAHDLSKVIQSKRSDYFAKSQDVEKETLFEYLNETRVNSEQSFLKIELEAIENDISKMTERITKLLNLGIYNPDEMSNISDSRILDEKLQDLKKDIENLSAKNFKPIDKLKNSLNLSLKSSLLKSYAENMRKKSDIFEDLELKIEFFMTHINALFRHKEMAIDLEKGFIFKLNDGLEMGKTIDPIDLSSGEQHEVILNYELIFKTECNSVILIDEPEISLHVLWQTKFIGNLLDIAKTNCLNIIVATHSPDIVNTHRNLVCALDEI